MFDLGVLGEELLHGGVLDLALVLTIDLVADEDEREFLRLLGGALVEELRDPGLDVIEGLLRMCNYAFVGDIVDKDAAIGAPVEGSSQASEFLLSGGVPDLNRRRMDFEVDDFAIDDHLLLHEVCADCGFVGLEEFLVDVAGWGGGYALRREVLPTLSRGRGTRSRRG
jgi:hypothetical protein